MKRARLHLTGLLWGVLLVAASCTKERSCENCLPHNDAVNQPPVAVAGADQDTAADSVLLDGVASYDPEGQITAYQWRKIDGPSSCQIVQAGAAQTRVRTLVAGVYRFELTVTDNGGLQGKDTVQVTVNAPATSDSCGLAGRPQVAARLTPVGQLSRSRSEIAVASAADKIVFAGGYISGGVSTSRVDIYNLTDGSWSTAELSEGRAGAAVAVLGDKIFFAGGYIAGKGSARVDIYDARTGRWSTAELSEGRAMMAGAAVGNKVVFAGGVRFNWDYSPRVDIYDAATNTWSTAELGGRTSTGTIGIAATVVGSKAYFAGEASQWVASDAGSLSSIINVYDARTNSWSTTTALGLPRGFMAAIAVDDKSYWAGGVYKQPPGPFSNHVEIRDMTTGAMSFGCLFQPNAFLQAVQRGRQIIFFTGAGTEKNKFDIYDVAANRWSIGVLPADLDGPFIISAGNTLYVAGGAVNGVSSTQVWQLDL